MKDDIILANNKWLVESMQLLKDTYVLTTLKNILALYNVNKLNLQLSGVGTIYATINIFIVEKLWAKNMKAVMIYLFDKYIVTLKQSKHKILKTIRKENT